MEILDLLRVMSNNDANLIKAIEGLKEKSKKGGIGMCDVIQHWVDIGSQQKAVEDAQNFLAMKILTPEQISKGTGLPLEQVLELQKQITVQA